MNITYTITEYNIDNNVLLIKPYCTQFKYPPEHYPALNFNLKDLTSTQDLKLQIADKVSGYILNTIVNENFDPTGVEIFLRENINKEITVTEKDLYKYRQDKYAFTNSGSADDLTNNSLSNIEFV